MITLGFGTKPLGGAPTFCGVGEKASEPYDEGANRLSGKVPSSA
jgi:hypothetical protein